MKAERIDGILFEAMLRQGAVNLERHRQAVNDLNVFPIPDGDTGDNMYMTISAGTQELSGKEHSISRVSSSAARGMLLGARGNSGVILSRLFAGIARGLDGKDEAGVPDLCDAFSLGVREAYDAVSEPTEGTILTVFREGVSYAEDRVSRESTAESFFDDFLLELRRSLERTPDLLDVLRESGVVDSGGAGFVCIAEGMKSALEGSAAEEAEMETQGAASARIDFSLFSEDSVLEYGYCTEFLLRLQRSKGEIERFDLSGLVSYLNTIGNSVVAFREGSIVKVHVHTMTPGVVLNHCQQFGEFLTLKIENMTLQHSERIAENRDPLRKQAPHKRYGIIAVASGSGIKNLFSSLGCDAVIEGGQSMNPAAEDFIRAFETINAETIFVFPNNGNVILTAQQAAALYDKARIIVLESKTIGEGYAAISMLDTNEENTEAIIGEMEEIIAGVKTGSVSQASRDSQLDGFEICSGDYIGFCGKQILSDSPEKPKAALSLLERMNAGESDILLMIYGCGTQETEARSVYDAVTKLYPRTETIMIDGGQPIYDYIFVLE
ncbi:MAG: DAK2 domain-containing protein [Clostridia bacterium]|nr:DAK2 domain-containing protein [Clostridia bacterium]